MTTISLTVSARASSDIASLVHKLRDRFTGVPMRLSLHVRPPAASVAYETLQRVLPDCRLIACWSEQEAICAASLSWSCSRSVWWPLSVCGEPIVQEVYDLAYYSEALDHNTRRKMLVSTAGYRSGEFLLPNDYSCVPCDVPVGAIGYDRRLVSSLVNCPDCLSRVPVAAWSLGLAVAISRRQPSYVVPTGHNEQMPAVSDVRRALAIGKEAGWRSRC